MAENKYKFNQETLQYEHAGKSRRKKIINLVLSQLAAALVVAFIIFVIFSYVAETPKQRALANENHILAQQYRELLQRKKNLDQYMQALREQDKHIYKSVFESTPEYKSDNITDIELTTYNMHALSDSSTAALRKAVKALQAQNKDYERIVKLLKSQSTEELSKIPSIQPLYNPDLKLPVYGYGSRIDPFYRAPIEHTGIDYAAPEGTKVFATADGTVRSATLVRANGNTVEIDHGNGYSTVYAHLENFACHAGKKVNRGDLIGYVGNSGKSLLPHLHYEIKYNSKPINPVSYFFMDLSPENYDKIRYTAAHSGLSLD